MCGRDISPAPARRAKQLMMNSDRRPTKRKASGSERRSGRGRGLRPGTVTRHCAFNFADAAAAAAADDEDASSTT